MTEYKPTGNVFKTTGFNQSQGKEKSSQQPLSIKNYKLQLAELIQVSRQKDEIIKDISLLNSDLQKQIQQDKQRLSELQKQIQALSKFQEQEQQKTEQQKEEEMQMLSNAIKYQQQAFGLFKGLTQQQILSIPVFQYQPGFTDSQICLTCYQVFENNTNIKCLPCCHSFHQLCIDESLRASKYCPACQVEVVLI